MGIKVQSLKSRRNMNIDQNSDGEETSSTITGGNNLDNNNIAQFLDSMDSVDVVSLPIFQSSCISPSELSPTSCKTIQIPKQSITKNRTKKITSYTDMVFTSSIKDKLDSDL